MVKYNVGPRHLDGFRSHAGLRYWTGAPPGTYWIGCGHAAPPPL
jgi:hypothetical protein